MQSILFIVSFPPNLNSSARFRIELYEELLNENGFKQETAYFWSKEIYFILYQNGKFFRKAMGMITGFLRRTILLSTASKYDYVFILRETTPVGPPIFEWIIAKILRKKIIYDFDDAIWIPLYTNRNDLAKKFKSFWKVGKICSWSYKVSAGSPFLVKYALQFNEETYLNPTCVDTINMHNKIKSQHVESENRVVIGWTGTFSNLKHLDIIVSVLQDLERLYEFDFLVIADQDPKLRLKNYKFIPWNADTEIQDLLNCNIGVMPLEDDVFSKGKCGFKLIQFMALGIPSLASPVGVNCDIIDEGVNGYLCNTHEEWRIAFEKLITNEELRTRMGSAGREKIHSSYSVASNADNFISLFS